MRPRPNITGRRPASTSISTCRCADRSARAAKIPAAALVYGESEAWAYVQKDAHTFLRTKVDITHPMDDGYFVTTIKPGEKVVSDGAGLLLSRETNPSTEVEE